MLEVRPCAFGVGVFTTTPLKAGEQVCVFSGPLMGYDATVALGDRECDPLQVSPDWYCAWGDPARLINHSCEPNCGIKYADSAGQVVAVRDIAAEEQLFWDYSTSIHANETWGLACGCGLPTCRKSIGPFADLPAELQQKYLGAGVVLPYLCSKAD